MKGEGHSSIPAPSPRRVRRLLVAMIMLVVAATGTAFVLRPGAGSTLDSVPDDGTQGVAVRAIGSTRRDLELTSRYPGELHADAAEIAARTPGLLLEVRVRLGDRVQRGEVLARIDTAKLVRQVREIEAEQAGAEAAGRRADAELRAAKAELERTEPLLGDQLVSAQEVDLLRARVQGLEADRAAARAQAEGAQARLGLVRQEIRDARLVAPFDGAVAERHLDPGAVVQHGTPILRLVRAGPLRVRFRVPERDLGRIDRDMGLSLTTQATRSRSFTGTVDRIAAAVSRDDRSIAVEGLLDEEHDALRPGMYAQVTLRLGVLRDVVTVPGAALLERAATNHAGDGIESGVYRIDEGRVGWQPVRILGRAGELVAVEGLAEGARVVTLGHETLRDGALVRVAEREP